LKPDFPEAWIFAGMMQRKLGNFTAALDAYSRGGRLAPNNPWIAESLGDVQYDLGDFRQAEKEYRRARQLDRARADLDSKLGLAQIRNGHSEEGLERLRKSIAKEPQASELHDRLIMASVWLGQPREAALAAENKLLQTKPTETDYLRAASIHAQLKDWGRAAELLRTGVSQFPHSEKLRLALTEIEAQTAKS
jgi:tetratricopeptide (TPR) repeat protein